MKPSWALLFRCKACNHVLTDEELYGFDNSDGLCSRCFYVSEEALRELRGDVLLPSEDFESYNEDKEA